jgi:hypothetical protein
MRPDLASGAVDGTKVALGSLTGHNIANSSLTGVAIAGNSLTGREVAEYSLATVPTATRASNVNGVTLVPIEFLEGTNTPERTLLVKSGLTLKASCSDSGDLEVWARTDRNARFLSWSVDSETGGTDNEIDDESFTNSEAWKLVGEDDGDQSGQTSYMTGLGDVVTVTWAADNNTSGAFGIQCAFIGTASIH